MALYEQKLLIHEMLHISMHDYEGMNLNEQPRLLIFAFVIEIIHYKPAKLWYEHMTNTLDL